MLFQEYNIGVCKYLYNYITINLVALSKQSYYNKIDKLSKTFDSVFGPECRINMGKNAKFEEYLHKGKYLPYRRYYIRDYLAGAVLGIDHKFALQQNEQKMHTNINGLILFNKNKIDNYLKEFYFNLITDERKPPKHGVGYEEGFNDGKNLKIGESIDGLKPKAYIP